MPAPARSIRLIYLLCLLSTFFLSFTFSTVTSPAAHAQAFASPITVLSETDSIAFPNAITFQLKAQDANSPITQATISITSHIEGSSNSALENVPVTQAATTVALSWQMATTGYNFLLPGSQVTYTWQLQDSSGTYTLPSQQFTMIDTRFSWQHLSRGMVQLNWYNNSNAFGQGLLAQAVGDVARISHNLGGSPSKPLHIWVYQSDSDFHNALPPGISEWVGGIAFPGLDECFIVVSNLSDNTVVRDMPHEITHLIFHQLIAQGIEPPLWFDEGLAVYNQLYHEPAMTTRLNEALNAHALIPLDQLYFNFPSDADQAYLAYAQSWNLVAYMYKTFGLNKMVALIHAINNQNYDFSQDLRKTIGEDTNHLENQWHLYLHQPPTLSTAQQNANQAQNATPVHVQLNDGQQSFYILLGILLILIPIAGGLALFIYLRRTADTQVQVVGHLGTSGYHPSPAAHQPQIGNQALSSLQQSAPATVQSYTTDWQSYTGSLPYTNPAYYTPLQEATGLANTPPTAWGPLYPAPAEQLGQLPENAASTYGENQEFISKPPAQQAPQD